MSLPAIVDGRARAAVAVASPIQSADDLAAAFLAGFGTATRQAYARDLRSWGSWLDAIGVGVLEAHRVHADAYVRDHESTLAPATLARRLSTLAGFYGYALDEGLIDRSPVARVRRPKVSDESPRFGLNREEVGQLLDAAERKPRDLALACLLTLNGLRVSEALAADVDDLSLERGHRCLRIVRKGGKVTTVPLAPRTAAAVDALVGDRCEGPIFTTRTGARLDRYASWKVIRRLATTAGVERPISPHSLRHTAATLALDAGVPLHKVQDLLSHASPVTTQRYNRARNSLDGHAAYALAAHIG